MVTDVVKLDGGYRVSGQKRFITNAPLAGFVVLLCRDGTMMTELVIDLDQAGVKVGKPDRKIGNNDQLPSHIYYSDVFVPDANLLCQNSEDPTSHLQSLITIQHAI